VTFADVVPDNIELVRRICRMKGIAAEFLWIERFEDIDRLPCGRWLHFACWCARAAWYTRSGESIRTRNAVGRISRPRKDGVAICAVTQIRILFDCE